MIYLEEDYDPKQHKKDLQAEGYALSVDTAADSIVKSIQVEQVTFKRPLRKTRTVTLRITGESPHYLSGRECTETGYGFGPEHTLKKTHITLRKAMPIRYDKQTPEPMPMPDQLRHLTGTAADPPTDSLGRFPVDPTAKELQTPDRSTYEQGASHAFKEKYVNNGVRDADRRKEDLPTHSQ